MNLLAAFVHAVVSAVENIAARTSTLTGTAFDTRGYEGHMGIIQHVGVVSGTTPTLDGKIQHSDTSGGTYTDVPGATFTQVTASNNLQKIVLDRRATKRFIKYIGTIAGTTPSFTFGVSFGGIKKAS
jgi:hypothetical protein